jgi:hypothetical protein
VTFSAHLPAVTALPGFQSHFAQPFHASHVSKGQDSMNLSPQATVKGNGRTMLGKKRTDFLVLYCMSDTYSIIKTND